MKKENLKNENSNEEYLDEDTKKIKKKFKSLYKWSNLLEGILYVPIGIFIIMIILTSIICMTEKNTHFIDHLLVELIEHEEGTDVGTEDLVKIVNLVTGQKLNTDDYKLDLENEFKISESTENTIIAVFAIIQIIMAIISYIILIVIVDNISKIFLNVSEKGTPFTEENIKHLNKINILAIVLFFIGAGEFSIGLVSLIIISAITYIFKYGYKLQQQVDETV